MIPASFYYDLQVIIPIYNVSAYLRECLESVFAQKSDYRICVTLVNDGSTDDSAKILQEQADREGVEIITQSNQGLSAARNAGLQRLRAPRVYFLDADDCLASPDALDTLLKLSLQTDADITEGSFIKVNDKGQELGRKVHSADKKDVSDLRFVKSSGIVRPFGFAWNKIIKAEVFRNIQFPVGYLFEDTIFNMLIFWQFSHFSLSPAITYRYRYNEQGLSMGSRKKLRIIDGHWVTRRVLNDYLLSGNKITQAYFDNFKGECKGTLKLIRPLHRPDVWLLVLLDNFCLKHKLKKLIVS